MRSLQATTSASQGLEFVLAGEHSYPADYPELGTEITVVGTFQTYEENRYMDCHLVDAEITESENRIRQKHRQLSTEAAFLRSG